VQRQAGDRGSTIEGDLDINAITSNTFEVDWPPKSDKMQLAR
jgi:predicted NUDIX family NTP pyrophosphohydrolase